MSKSLKRVIRALQDAGLPADILELSQARTAAEAATGAQCHVDQIAKSMIFSGADSGRAILFLTAGGAQVDLAMAGQVAGETLNRADAGSVRAQTGFAIGGVSPVGHLAPIRGFMDKRLMDFDRIWAAAGTPHHIFPISPTDLHRITGAQLADFTGFQE